MEFPRTKFTPLAIEERPHDTTGLAKGWSFKTLEHDAHTFPHAIEATDPARDDRLPMCRSRFGGGSADGCRRPSNRCGHHTKLRHRHGFRGDPSFNHPFAVKPTKGAEVGDEVYLFGEVTRADDHAITVDFDDGGRVTLNEDVLTLVEKAKPQKFAGRDNARRPR